MVVFEAWLHGFSNVFCHDCNFRGSLITESIEKAPCETICTNVGSTRSNLLRRPKSEQLIDKHMCQTNKLHAERAKLYMQQYWLDTICHAQLVLRRNYTLRANEITIKAGEWESWEGRDLSGYIPSEGVGSIGDTFHQKGGIYRGYIPPEGVGYVQYLLYRKEIGL